MQFVSWTISKKLGPPRGAVMVEHEPPRERREAKTMMVVERTAIPCRSAARKILPRPTMVTSWTFQAKVLKHQELSGPLHVILTHLIPFI